MIRLISARRLEALEDELARESAARVELEDLLTAALDRAETAERRADEAVAEAAAAREAGREVAEQTWQMYRAAQARAEELEDLARLAPSPNYPPQRIDQWSWAHIALRVASLLAEEHADRAGLAPALEAAEEQVAALLIEEYGIDGDRREVAR